MQQWVYPTQMDVEMGLVQEARSIEFWPNWKRLLSRPMGFNLPRSVIFRPDNPRKIVKVDVKFINGENVHSWASVQLQLDEFKRNPAVKLKTAALAFYSFNERWVVELLRVDNVGHFFASALVFRTRMLALQVFAISDHLFTWFWALPESEQITADPNTGRVYQHNQPEPADKPPGPPGPIIPKERR